jgi:hypothetical protein
MSAETRRGARHIALGCGVLATAPVVGWFAFTYHVLVGLAVSLIYGSAAFVIGASGIARGAATIAGELRARRAQKELEQLPKARLLSDRSRD